MTQQLQSQKEQKKQSDKLRIAWIRPESNLEGNAFGYNSHNNSMRKACAELFDFDDDAEIALTITPADFFKPIPGKINVLFTMFETLDIPDSYVTGLNKADAIIVPCRFCKEIFRQYTNKPIFVCWEGVDPDQYSFYPRTFPDVQKGEAFRFLWVGAPNMRKGYPIMIKIAEVLSKTRNVEVYFKTTMQKIGWKGAIRNAWRRRKEIFYLDRDAKNIFIAIKRMWLRIPRPTLNGKVMRFGKTGNVVFDSRKLPMDELIDLYRSAHCFVLPTTGEGWGLTLSEAMATGAPCIAPAITGCADFFDDSVGYTVKHEIIQMNLENYNLKSDAYLCDTQDVLNKMMHVATHYGEALKKGESASHRMRTKFTWEKSALRLKEIIEEIKK